METIDNIITDEGGYQSEVYLCTAGKRTWLIGRNIEDRPITKIEWGRLSQMLKEGKTMKEWAYRLFETDIRLCYSDLVNTYGINLMMFSDEIQVVLMNMAYNMGTSRFNPVKWPKFFKALKEGNWSKAADEMENSRWYRQTKSRAIRLTQVVRNI